MNGIVIKSARWRQKKHPPCLEKTDSPETDHRLPNIEAASFSNI